MGPRLLTHCQGATEDTTMQLICCRHHKSTHPTWFHDPDTRTMATFAARKYDKVRPLIMAETASRSEHCTCSHGPAAVHAVYVQVSYTKRRRGVRHMTADYNLVGGWTMLSCGNTGILKHVVPWYRLACGRISNTSVSNSASELAWRMVLTTRLSVGQGASRLSI